MKILPETALTYDDVLLVPQYSSVDSRRTLSTKSWLTKKISLQLPIISANMDVVTESEMAITMAREGGIGIIHRFMTIKEQARQIESLPGVGKVRARKIMEKPDIASTRKIKGLGKNQRIALLGEFKRFDVVIVLDTSGSMRGKRMEQAINALNYCVGNLHKQDRFAIIHFATTVNKYHEEWLQASADNIGQAKKWVSGLSATGGTNIDGALATALAMRTKEKGRTFNIIFFTDGQPTAYFLRGRLYCEWPLSFGGISMRAAQETLKEVERVTRRGITINTFIGICILLLALMKWQFERSK